MKSPHFLISLVCCLCLSGNLSAQRRSAKTSPGLSTAEEQAARAFATRFILRLNETRDFTPLVKEYFRPDFITIGRRYLAEQKFTTEQFQKGGFDKRFVMQAVSTEGLRSLYIALLNQWDAKDHLQNANRDYVAANYKVADWTQLWGRDGTDWQRISLHKELGALFFNLAEENPFLHVYASLLDVIESKTEAELIVQAALQRISTRQGLQMFLTKARRMAGIMQVAERRLKVSLKQIGGTPNPLNLHICRFDGD